MQRVMQFGTEVTSAGVNFRVWAPRRQQVQVRLQGDDSLVPLASEGNGFFSGHREHLEAGARYNFRLDDDAYDYPDPASRYQPDGVHGCSEVVDPNAFVWNDSSWQGIELPGQVIYEMHLGCFTEEGTWKAAEQRLHQLSKMGITVLEIMPVTEFNGDFGWGYDGVKWYAPSRLYGTPDEFRHFVDTAHQLGLAVILDVVYNHFGPTGNYAAEDNSANTCRGESS